MLFKASNESFCNKLIETKFKLEHMWRALHNQPMWCVRHGDDDLSDVSKRSCLNLDDD
jgi:hypothetical protein